MSSFLVYRSCSLIVNTRAVGEGYNSRSAFTSSPALLLQRRVTVSGSEVVLENDAHSIVLYNDKSTATLCFGVTLLHLEGRIKLRFKKSDNELWSLCTNDNLESPFSGGEGPGMR
jgi:hypothetical protein